MDELLENAKKALRSFISDEELERQLLENRQKLEKLSTSQTDLLRQLTSIKQHMTDFEIIVKQLECMIEEQKRVMNEFVTWKKIVENAALSVANVQQTPLQKGHENELFVNDEREQKAFSKTIEPVSAKVEKWPVRFYADSFSSFSPYGFCINDLQSEYMGQLYIIDQLSSTEATFTVNSQLEFSQILSNYKYGLKPVCDEISRNENPSRLCVVEPGVLSFNGTIWEIKTKISINII